MRNPRTWNGPTPANHKAKIDRSGPDKDLSAHGRPTMVKPTSMDHYMPVPKSGTGRKELGQGSTMMGMPHAKASDRKEMPVNKMGMHPTIEKSMPSVPKEPVKWHKKYKMSEL